MTTQAEHIKHPNEDADPRGLYDSDPIAVREIVAMEMDIQKMYNEEFLKTADAPLVHYDESPDLIFYDIFTPGELVGENVRKYYNFIGPQYVGRLELKEIQVFAKGEVGFVVMKQHYYGKDSDGQEFHWVLRQTDGVVKRDGKWLINHTHISFPVDHINHTADLQSFPLPLPWDRQAQGS